MKASELIFELQNLINKYGDLPVSIDKFFEKGITIDILQKAFSTPIPCGFLIMEERK